MTSLADRKFLETIIIARDNRNAGMPRKELIGIIAEFAGVSFKTAENHLDYLFRKRHLPNLKSYGRVVRAQATTTNRMAVTTEKLLRTHSSQEEGESCYLFYAMSCFLRLY